MLSPKSKAAATTSAPTMNQLATGGVSKQSMTGTTFVSTPSPAAPVSAVSAPNYNINTASSQGAAPVRMGVQPGGMGQPGYGGVGMNYGGVPGGMGYVGMGTRPGYGGGFVGQPGYGGQGPMGMGMQQQQRPF